MKECLGLGAQSARRLETEANELFARYDVDYGGSRYYYYVQTVLKPRHTATGCGSGVTATLPQPARTRRVGCACARKLMGLSPGRRAPHSHRGPAESRRLWQCLAATASGTGSVAVGGGYTRQVSLIRRLCGFCRLLRRALSTRSALRTPYSDPYGVEPSAWRLKSLLWECLSTKHRELGKCRRLHTLGAAWQEKVSIIFR